MALFRRSQPVRVLLGVARYQGLPGRLDLLDVRFSQPWIVLELLTTAADTNSRDHKLPAVGIVEQCDHLRLLPPIVRTSLAAQSRNFSTTRSLTWPFQPTPPSLFPDSALGKDASTAKTAPKASATRPAGLAMALGGRAVDGWRAHVRDHRRPRIATRQSGNTMT
jgi:LETM1 and EF-hand domain-containing protein 1